MTNRVMGDSTNLIDIPPTVQVAAVYFNGRYAVTQAQLAARFPHDRYGWCWIDGAGSNADKADVLDVETGDATPATANLWVQSWHVLKRPGLPVLYVNRGNMGAVEAACKTGGSVLGTHYLLWVATLDGTEYTGPGVAACQWKGQAQTGGHWDESVVYDASLWPTVTSSPPPPPAVTKVQAQTALATLTRYVNQ